MKKSFSIMIAVLILVTGTISLFGQATSPEKLAAGTYTVYARAPQAWRVVVDSKTMSNATISGRVTVTAGTPTSLEVMVFNEETYWKWRSDDDAVRLAAKPLFTSGKTTQADLNVKLPDGGIYFLVLSCAYQYEGTKTVTADTRLQFDKK